MLLLLQILYLTLLMLLTLLLPRLLSRVGVNLTTYSGVVLAIVTATTLDDVAAVADVNDVAAIVIIVFVNAGDVADADDV